MLDKKGFDLWANGYDSSVNLSQESNTFPFAGYKKVLNTIYQQIKQQEKAKILDVGFGTAMLSQKLYEEGYVIYGFDFSNEMIEIAKNKMPKAKLIQYDFSAGYPIAFEKETFDFIVCTYAIHHLDLQPKIIFLKELLKHLNKGGKIFIGDVAFERNAQLEECKKKNEKEWDQEEIYPVWEEFKDQFQNVSFTRISFCAGVLTLSN